MDITEIRDEIIEELLDELDTDIMVQIMNIEDKIYDDDEIKTLFEDYLFDSDDDEIKTLFENYVMTVDKFIKGV